jgi:hypothetical protein
MVHAACGCLLFATHAQSEAAMTLLGSLDHLGADPVGDFFIS